MAVEAPQQISDLHTGAKFNHYQMLEPIGRGGQGVVWSALDPQQDRIVAIKFNEITSDEIFREEDGLSFERQIGKLVNLSHPHILPILDFGQYKQYQYLVSPYVAGGSLFDRIKTAPIYQKDFLRIAADITDALSYLHQRGVVHRDLKPSNILIDAEQNLYITDFGLAREVSLTTASVHTGRGTPPYAPPEQHTMVDVSPQSDIYSFGIVLYEMLTRRLPWSGKKTLGIQQLHTQDEIPDPRDIDSRLPPGLVGVLRKMTAADPQDRPSSVEDIMPLLEEAFKDQPVLSPPTADPGSPTLSEGENLETLESSPVGVGPEINTIPLNLTNFALRDLEKMRAVEESTAPDTTRFMLANALTFNYRHEYWWSRVSDPLERLEVASTLLSRSNMGITSRIMHHLLHDEEIHKLEEPLTQEYQLDLFEMAVQVNNPALRRQALEVLESLTPPASEWGQSPLNSDQEEHLAAMALEDSAAGNAAANLIGHWRCHQAVETISKHAEPDRLGPALLEIQQRSGSLPSFLPRSLRLYVTSEWVAQRLKTRPFVFLSAFLLTFVGVGLPFGVKEYLSIARSGFLNMLNIILSLERGALLGAPFGIAILLTRMIADRFPEVKALLRIPLSTIVGGILLSISIFTYDVLVLTTVPHGFLYIAGCFLIAFGFALSALKPSRLWKISISALAVFTALGGSWLGYLFLADSSFYLTPVFFFKTSWSPYQILLTILVLTASMSITGNLVDLSVHDR